MRALIVSVAALAATAVLAIAAPPGDSARGAKVYERCGACHSLDANRAGPRHRGLFGRKAGTVPGFAYSPAMKRADLVWSEETLERFLANPLKVVPGTRMYVSVPDAQERADLIAYLRSAAR